MAFIGWLAIAYLVLGIIYIIATVAKDDWNWDLGDSDTAWLVWVFGIALWPIWIWANWRDR